jgi:hypothetical protein
MLELSQAFLMPLLMRNKNYIAKADYSNNSEIDQIVKSILDQISLKASVKLFHQKNGLCCLGR